MLDCDQDFASQGAARMTVDACDEHVEVSSGAAKTSGNDSPCVGECEIPGLELEKQAVTPEQKSG